MSEAPLYIRVLRARRRSLNISQEQLGRRMKAKGYPWSRHIIIRLETGKRPLTVDEFLAVCPLLKLDPAEALDPDAGLRAAIEE